MSEEILGKDTFWSDYETLIDKIDHLNTQEVVPIQDLEQISQAIFTFSARIRAATYQQTSTPPTATIPKHQHTEMGNWLNSNQQKPILPPHKRKIIHERLTEAQTQFKTRINLAKKKEIEKSIGEILLQCEDPQKNIDILVCLNIIQKRIEPISSFSLELDPLLRNRFIEQIKKSFSSIANSWLEKSSQYLKTDINSDNQEEEVKKIIPQFSFLLDLNFQYELEFQDECEVITLYKVDLDKKLQDYQKKLPNQHIFRSTSSYHQKR